MVQTDRGITLPKSLLQVWGEIWWTGMSLRGVEAVLQHFPVGFPSSDAHRAVIAGKPLNLQHMLDPSVFSPRKGKQNHLFLILGKTGLRSSMEHLQERKPFGKSL